MSDVGGGIIGGIGDWTGWWNEGGPVYKQMGGPLEDPMMPPGMPQEGAPMPPQPPVDPMMDEGMPMDPMAAGGAPMGGGIMGGQAPIETQEPMMGDPMMDMGFELEPMSEIDKVEDAVEMLIATTGAPLTVTRKVMKAKSKKGG